MKTLKTAQALLAVALLGLASSAFAASYNGVFPGVVPDNDPAGISDTISITDAGVISSMTIDVAIDHTWVGDLIMTLTAPDGTVLTLMDRPGSTGGVGVGTNVDIFNISFDDASLIAAEDIANDGEVLAPDDMLAALNGMSITGDWTLFISDNAGGDTNDIAPEWTINATTTVVPVPAAIWFMISGLAGLGFMRRK